jgi:LysR family hydrogen peroxide-inducible transcriptional activator
VEIHQLQYFVAVVETGGFSKAAERCNVAQPSLSQQIIKLEQELGRPLFDRLGRGVALTEAGHALLPHARRILAEVQEIRRGLHTEIGDGRGHLAVGAIPTVAPFLLPEVIKLFTQHFPQAKLSVQEDFTEELIRSLIVGKLDVAIMSLPIHHKQIVVEELFTEPLLVAYPRNHELISRSKITTQELSNFPFIALNEIHCLGEQIQSFCIQQSVDIDIVCQTSQLVTVQNCVTLGLGISLVPQMLAARDQSGSIVYRMVSGTVPERKIVAAYHRGRLQSFLTRKFVELVQEEHARLIHEKMG